MPTAFQLREESDVGINVSVTHQKPFQASQPDELTIEEQEILEVIDDGDMEDWVKVNYVKS